MKEIYAQREFSYINDIGRDTGADIQSNTVKVQFDETDKIDLF